jgi:hypothetical protein
MFYISTYLPRIGKTAKLKEFTNRDYFSLSKFYHNKDTKGIVDFFNNKLQDLIINKELYCELTCVEKFNIWLDLYYNCLHENISLFSKSINDHINIKITELINNVNNLYQVEERDITVGNIVITLNTPFSLYIDNTDDIFSNIIYSIKSDDKVYYFQNFTQEEKNLFLSSLPVDLFDTIINYYKSLNKETFDILPQSERISFDPIELSATNGAMFAFLKSIFDTELRTHYSNALFFTKQLNGNLDSYYDMTYKDFIALYKIFESNMKAERKDLNMPAE